MEKGKRRGSNQRLASTSIQIKQPRVMIRKMPLPAKIYLGKEVRAHFFMKKNTPPPAKTPTTIEEKVAAARHAADKLVWSEDWSMWAQNGSVELFRKALEAVKEKPKTRWIKRYQQERPKLEKLEQEAPPTKEASNQPSTSQVLLEHNYAISSNKDPFMGVEKPESDLALPKAPVEEKVEAGPSSPYSPEDYPLEIELSEGSMEYTPPSPREQIVNSPSEEEMETAHWRRKTKWEADMAMLAAQGLLPPTYRKFTEEEEQRMETAAWRAHIKHQVDLMMFLNKMALHKKIEREQREAAREGPEEDGRNLERYARIMEHFRVKYLALKGRLEPQGRF
jgi:hypothetical protein